jgi:hypothetical protein
VTQADASPAWLPLAAACAACAAFLLVALDVGVWHPGYAYGDERIVVCWLQNLREGAPLQWQFSRGCLTRTLQWLWVEAAGTDLGTLHTPGMAVLALEWLFLALVARRWFDDETAAWSVLAISLSAQTWVRARSLLAFQALPMESLLLALMAGKVRGRAAALVWGLAASLVFLDYDGALIALPAVWLACVALDAPFRKQALYSALGLAVGGVALLWHGQGGPFSAYVAARLGTGLAGSGDPGLGGRLRFLGECVTGGPALPYFGVTHWPAWPVWAWAPLAAGAWSLRRSAAGVLVAWAAGAVLLTQMVHSSYGFPLHRLAAAAPALALVTGIGMVRLRRRLGRRAWVLGVLLAAGAASEGWAWWRHQQAFAPELYDRCEGLEEVRLAYRRDLADPSLRLVTQLDGSSQADARFVLDRPLSLGGPPPMRVLALLPADYAQAWKALGGEASWFWVAKGFEPAVAVLAQGAPAARLAAIEDSLVPLVGTEEDAPPQRLKRIEAWLREAKPRDPWTWTAAVEADVETAVQVAPLNAEQFARLAAPGLLSAAPWTDLARASYLSYPRAAVEYCRSAEALDPADGEALLIEAASLKSLGDPRAAELSQAWVSLRASGKGWRHTQ